MPYLRAHAVAASESAASLSFEVYLDAASANEVSVRYGLDAATAVYSGSAPDFRAQSGTLVFAPGETRKTITVALVDNGTPEATEVFWLNLNSPTNATVAQRWTPAFVFDNDAAAGTPAIHVTAPVVDEGARTADFFVWLSRPSTLPVAVSFSTGDDTAAAGQDYRAVSGLLSFAPGEMVKTVSVDIIDDAAAEGREVFRLALSSPSNATLAQPFGVAEIGPSDGPRVGAPYVTARALAVGEGEVGGQFVITLSHPSPNEVRVNFGLDAGSAVYSGSAPDFRSYSGTLVFAPGETTKTLPFIVVDNGAAEPTELFWLDLNSPVNAVVKQRWTPGYVFDDDAVTGTPVVRVSSPVVDESAGVAAFFVSLSRPSTGVVSVDYRTDDGTAVAGQDYRAAAGRLVFQPGEVVKTVLVDVVDDAAAETQEFFNLRLTAPSGATLADGFGTGEIGPSDAPSVGQPYVRARPLAVGEGDDMVAFVVSLSAPSPSEVRVNFGLDSGSAVYSGSAPDFRSYSGTLVFAPGETTKTLPFIVVDDSTSEKAEGFWLDLNSPVNAIVAQRWTPAVIVDNDAATGTPAISVGDVVVDEQAGVAAFTVSLSRPSMGVVLVDYRTADDTAHAGQDYRPTGGWLEFQPGEVVKTVLVEILEDDLTEGDEWFQMILEDPRGATLADAIGAAMIGRSDGVAVSRPQIFATPVVASEGDGAARFVVQLSAPSSNEVRVNFSFDSGSALYSGSAPDFRSYSGTLVFAPGETVKDLWATLVDDTAVEGDELFSLDLNSPVNATLSQRYASAIVIDDDGAGKVFSYGIGNDLYSISSALDRIAEGPRGGIDTVISTISYTLPDHVENLVLTAGALNGLGNAGHNVFRGTADNNLIDGKEGIDTVVFSGRFTDYAINGGVASRTVTSAVEGTDTLLSIERLQFSDRVLVQDTLPGGHTWGGYAMFNAAFDRAPSQAELSRWTAQLDRVGSLEALAQAMINHYAPGVSDEVLVQHLWSTIVETPIPLDALSTYVGLVRGGTYSQAQLLELVTTLDLNTVEIVGIVGQTLTLDPAYFPLP